MLKVNDLKLIESSYSGDVFRTLSIIYDVAFLQKQ